MKILEWMTAGDKGLSSECIAIAALGEIPKRPNYPHDGDDFGRCYRLLKVCPDAKVGLERLGKDGGQIWGALVARWAEIETAYLHDMAKYERGDRRRNGTDDWKCYDLMQSIIRPIEDAERSVIRTKHGTIHL